MACKDCGSSLKKTEWRPPEGLDPRLREFKCKNDHTEYKILSKTAFHDEWVKENSYG